ncbi:MAG: hypothetical protein JW793_14520 [Acidobacteria bacterium]|nr:hypothetical protein [Acidobacteriota bacterium]
MNRKRPGKIGILAVLLLWAFAWPSAAESRKFYQDDPLLRWPQPRNVEAVRKRKISDYYDFFFHTFGRPGDHPSDAAIPAGAVNTLGEAPDSEWYTGRHYRRRMSMEELQRGAGNENAPDTGGILTVTGAKNQGITPGFSIEDSGGRRYLVKFDPITNPEMATAADIISSKFLYALGYNVPEYYIIEFRPDQIRVDPGATVTDSQGRERPLTKRDVTDLLLGVPQNADGTYRAIASLFLEGNNIGEFRFFGTRSDDPNDTVPHERRRDLRGYRVFSAWLNHDDSRAVNTLDMLVEEGGIRFIKHYLIDFGSTLGSATSQANSPRAGNEYLFSWKPSLLQLFTLGLYVPRWARADFPDIPSVGRFGWEVFDPVGWVPEYYNPAFANCLPEDAFWAARQVMAFTDEEIRAVVRTGKYSDPAAEDWVVECLIRRRDKIGRAFFSKVLPLDRFEIKNGTLSFEDLEIRHGFRQGREYAVEWFLYDNERNLRQTIAAGKDLTLPDSLKAAHPGDYFGAFVVGDDPGKSVVVYFRKQTDRVAVVGIDRIQEPDSLE